ncbi:hypothetical protein AALP_AA1G021000 [Arabis alpina]|uniref:Uncharacterized protein n=1 Tax=Arabis alpina TaxID=50452 RepID=A0A087HKI4_ARAAL|nr:hypothetical protein AALP_AA1G021000 [Arabis alpina]
MARSLANAKIFFVFVSEEFSNAIFRRGFCAAAKTASQGNVTSGVTGSAAVLKKNVGGESTEKAPWVPDPKTGYYRPETGYEEIDAAELRAVLLNHKH